MSGSEFAGFPLVTGSCDLSVDSAFPLAYRCWSDIRLTEERRGTHMFMACACLLSLYFSFVIFMPACMSVHQMPGVFRGQKRVPDPPNHGIMEESCKPSHGCWESNVRPLGELPGLLSMEPPFWLHVLVFPWVLCTQRPDGSHLQVPPHSRVSPFLPELSIRATWAERSLDPCR